MTLDYILLRSTFLLGKTFIHAKWCKTYCWIKNKQQWKNGHRIKKLIKLKDIFTFSRNTSLLVIFLTAVSVSCTIPMTGLLAWGVMIIRGVTWRFSISARVSMLWGTCKFISSPSKSALYGDVTDKFIRKVDQGNTCKLIVHITSATWLVNYIPSI